MGFFMPHENKLPRLDAESPPAHSCGALENMLDFHMRKFSEGKINLKTLNETKSALRNCIYTTTNP